MELLYTFKYKSKETSEDYIKKALRIYEQKKGIRLMSPLKIKRTQNGKPYIEGESLHFSISHSKEFWACLISEKPIGMDVEKYRDKDYIKIAKRFFTKEESEYVATHGREGFLSIWTRKEAYTKFHGSTLGENLQRVETLKNGKFCNKINSLYVEEIFIDKRFKCVYVAAEKEKIWINPMD